MKRILLMTWCLLLISTVAFAEMDFIQSPQYPYGWDVSPKSGSIGDDWLSMGAGSVTAIRFWGGYKSDVVVPVTFTVSIYDNDDSTSLDKPGGLRWSGVFSPGQYTETECPELDGSYGFYVSLSWSGSLDNHTKTYRYDIEIPAGVFEQEPDNIYWLVMKADSDAWGWRTSEDSFGSYALYAYYSNWASFWPAMWDRSTNQASDLAFVIDPATNSVPEACAGEDRTVEQENYDGTEVTLDGSCSTDPDSTPETNDDILSFDWYEGEALLGSGEVITHTFPRGIHTVTLEVADSAGETAEDEVIVTVQDTTPPGVNVLVAKDFLWPPNHNMVDIGYSVDVSDIGDAEPALSIQVTSDEATATAPDAGGKKHAPDAEIADDGSVLLRAERSGEGDGRVYVITVTATDMSGNSASGSAWVKVNHDKKREAVDSGQDYDATEIN